MGYLTVLDHITDLELASFVKRNNSFVELCFDLGYQRNYNTVKNHVISKGLDVSHFVTKKKCFACSKIKTFDKFGPNKYRSDRKANRCKLCASLKNEFYKTQPQNRLLQHEQNLKYKWGIGFKEYNVLLKRQNGVCAICGGVNKVKRLSVDHCHTSGRIRGLLCQQCNVGLGNFKDDINLLNKAIAYLNQQ